MIHDHQQRYLDSLPETDKVARVVPFDPKSRLTAESMIKTIKNALPDAQVFYQGSTALGIAGENDIDLTILISDFERGLTVLTELFGEASQAHHDSRHAHWDFMKEGFQVDMGLQSEMTLILKEQLKTQDILEKDESLRKTYEEMKSRANGVPWKEYLKRKYEFWNHITE